MADLPHWSLNDDQTKLRVDFPVDPPVRFEFDAYDLDDFIANLAEMRAAMKPAVPMSDPDPNTRILAATTGRFYVQRRAEHLVISFLHPGLRWVGMVFGQVEAKNFADTILRHLPAQSDGK